jgi:hypothetical protein
MGIYENWIVKPQTSGLVQNFHCQQLRLERPKNRKRVQAMTNVLQTECENAFLYLGKGAHSPQKRRRILAIEYTGTCTRES